MKYNGTKKADTVEITSDVTMAAGRRGDDHFLFQSDNDCTIDGGFGFDVFEYQIHADVEVKFHEINDDKSVIKMFDADTGERLHKIVLFDIEQIDAFAIG